MTSSTHFPVPFGPFILQISLTFVSTSGNFLTVRDPPYGEKFEHLSEMLFLIAQIKRFGTLNAIQKNRSPLNSTVFEKIRKLL
jgi:hypothetical protein